MSYSNEMFREMILDHVKNPKNKSKSHENYLSYTLKNPSCGDIVTVYLKVEDNIITDLTYDIEGCSICTSSTSIMSELVIGKSLNDFKNINENFNKMLINEKFDEEVLGEAICLSGIKDVPTRIKCATLPFKALVSALDKEV